jgi:hypothetical protein
LTGLGASIMTTLALEMFSRRIMGDDAAAG